VRHHFGMGAPVTRMVIAPVNRAHARWLRCLVRHADEIIAAHSPDPRDDGDGYRDLIAALDVGRRALTEYDRRPWWRRWKAPGRQLWERQKSRHGHITCRHSQRPDRFLLSRTPTPRRPNKQPGARTETPQISF
jgi:hypothetical protein